MAAAAHYPIIADGSTATSYFREAFQEISEGFKDLLAAKTLQRQMTNRAPVSRRPLACFIASGD
jgi:hypothetical protein